MTRHLGWLLLLALIGCQKPAPPVRRLKRVNDQIGQTFQTLSDTHRFESVVPRDWKTDHFSAGGERLELGFVDGSGAMHSVELLIAPPPAGPTHGQGPHFWYRFARGADTPSDSQALLAAAALLDNATPEEALLAVEAEVEPSSPAPITSTPPPTAAGTRPLESKTISRPTALVIGAVQSLLILAAILMGIVAPLRSRKEQR